MEKQKSQTRTRQASRYNEDRLADTILASMRLPLVVVDGAGAIIYVNGAGEEFLARSLRHIQHKPLGAMFTNSQPLTAMLAKAQTSRMSVSGLTLELELSNSQFGKRLADVHISPLLDYDAATLPAANGDASQAPPMLLMFYEAQLSERLRAQIPQAAAGRRMSVFAAMLAHEVKTPLAAIRGASELLHKADKQQHNLTQLIISETDRVTKLINRMESLASDSPMRMQPVNIHRIIDHCLTVAASSYGNGYTIHRQFDPSLPETMGDEDLLIQAFTNLIKNACEATDKKAEIIVATLYDTGPRLSLAAGDASMPMLSVLVKNYGSGIDPSLGGSVFDLFTTSKESGSGLGLALVARVASRHKGTVEAQEEADGATCFRFCLPIVAINGVAGT